MNVALNTDEQKNEFIARLLFLLSNYRYFERMYDDEPGRELKEVLQNWRKRIDDYLQQVGVLEYKTLAELRESVKHITIKDNDDDTNTVHSG